MNFNIKFEEINKQFESINKAFQLGNKKWDSWKFGNELPQIKKVIFNDSATIVFWDDNTKTVSRCHQSDNYDKYMGIIACIAKKYYGSGKKLHQVLDKWVSEATEYNMDKDNNKNEAEYGFEKPHTVATTFFRDKDDNWYKTR